jgi:hypothetical protein
MAVAIGSGYFLTIQGLQDQEETLRARLVLKVEPEIK